MVGMQVRAHHEVDVGNREARCLRPANIGVVGLHVPFRTRRPRLVIADAGVNQDGVMRRLDDVGLKAQDQRVLVVERLRISHPSPVLGKTLPGQIGKHLQRRQERSLLLDDTVDREVADGEFEAHCRGPVPTFRSSCHVSAPTLSRTSESYGHWQIYDSSAAFLFEVPEQNLPLVLQELQIGGTSECQAGGGSEIFTEDRSSIFWWKASSFG